MPDNLPESQASSISQTGTTATIVAAIPGRRIKLTSLILSSTAACGFNLQSHTTTSKATGTVNINTTTSIYPVILDYHPDGWFTTSVGEGLDLVTSTTASGWCTWTSD